MGYRIKTAAVIKEAIMSSGIDPICVFHQKRLSEHQCLYCCLCFRNLTIEECHVQLDGKREDVCNECAAIEERLIEITK